MSGTRDVVILVWHHLPDTQMAIAQCQDRHEHHGGAQSDQFNTVYIDEICTGV